MTPKHFSPVKIRFILGRSKLGSFLGPYIWIIIICPYQVKDWGPTNRPQMTTDHHGRPQMTTDDHHLECKNSQNGVILGRSKLGSFLTDPTLDRPYL